MVVVGVRNYSQVNISLLLILWSSLVCVIGFYEVDLFTTFTPSSCIFVGLSKCK